MTSLRQSAQEEPETNPIKVLLLKQLQLIYQNSYAAFQEKTGLKDAARRSEYEEISKLLTPTNINKLKAFISTKLEAWKKKHSPADYARSVNDPDTNQHRYIKLLHRMHQMFQLYKLHLHLAQGELGSSQVLIKEIENQRKYEIEVCLVPLPPSTMSKISNFFFSKSAEKVKDEIKPVKPLTQEQIKEEAKRSFDAEAKEFSSAQESNPAESKIIIGESKEIDKSYKILQDWFQKTIVNDDPKKRYEQADKEYKIRETEFKAEKEKVDSLKGTINNLSEELMKIKKELEEAKNKLDGTKDDNTELKRIYAEKNAILANAQTAFNDKNKDLRSAESTFGAAKNALKEAQTNRDDALLKSKAVESRDADREEIIKILTDLQTRSFQKCNLESLQNLNLLLFMDIFEKLLKKDYWEQEKIFTPELQTLVVAVQKIVKDKHEEYNIRPFKESKESKPDAQRIPTEGDPYFLAMFHESLNRAEKQISQLEKEKEATPSRLYNGRGS